MPERLQQTIIAYLESKGWYFDWDHINEVWDSDSPTSLNKRPDAIRTLHGWTLPQWGEYWSEPYSDDPTHKNYGKPKTRRHETLHDALWSQLLREEEPGTYGVFYGDPAPEKKHCADCDVPDSQVCPGTLDGHHSFEREDA